MLIHFRFDENLPWKIVWIKWFLCNFSLKQTGRARKSFSFLSIWLQNDEWNVHILQRIGSIFSINATRICFVLGYKLSLLINHFTILLISHQFCVGFASPFDSICSVCHSELMQKLLHTHAGLAHKRASNEMITIDLRIYDYEIFRIVFYVVDVFFSTSSFNVE